MLAENMVQMNSQDSSILIVTIDCNHKLKGGNTNYQSNNSIFTSDIDDTNKSFIMVKRQEIFELLKTDKIRWNRDRSELRINKGLKKGSDFSFPQPDSDVLYLPAMYRYRGGFYGGLEDSGRELMTTSKHHFLILSACYGLLRPFEPIQYYSCQFGDKNEAYRLWTQNKFISNLLIDFIKKYKISRIFDFTYCSVEAFHDCFDWKYIQEKTGVEILHAYHRWDEGDDALYHFGAFFKTFMLERTSQELLNLDSDTYYEDILFKTEKRQDSLSNLLDEFEINIRKLIHKVLDKKYPDFWQELKKIDTSEKPITDKTQKGITLEIIKNPFLKEHELERLHYCDIYDYQKIIIKFWDAFSPVFLSKDTMKKHFDNIVELRNPTRHVRQANKVQIEMGKASIKWFDKIFKEQEI